MNRGTCLQYLHLPSRLAQLHCATEGGLLIVYSTSFWSGDNLPIKLAPSLTPKKTPRWLWWNNKQTNKKFFVWVVNFSFLTHVEGAIWTRSIRLALSAQCANPSPVLVPPGWTLYLPHLPWKWRNHPNLSIFSVNTLYCVGSKYEI